MPKRYIPVAKRAAMKAAEEAKERERAGAEQDQQPLSRHNSRGELESSGNVSFPSAASGEATDPGETEKVKRPLAGAAARSVAGAAARQGLPSSGGSSAPAWAQPQAPGPARNLSGMTSSLNKLGSSRSNPDEHPFEVGHCLVVSYRDNSPRIAKIISVSGNKTENRWCYYVHYFDFNRRMDEWITPDRVLKLPSEANPLGQERMEAEAQAHRVKSPTVITTSTIREDGSPRRKRGRPSKSTLLGLSPMDVSQDARPAPSHRAIPRARRDQNEATNESERRVGGRLDHGVDMEDEDEDGDGDDGSRTQNGEEEGEGDEGDEEEDDDEEEEEDDDEDEEYDDNYGHSQKSSGGAMGHLKSHTPNPSSSHSVAYSANPFPSQQSQRRKAYVPDDSDPSRPTTIEELEHDEHEGLDAAQLLEHEEWTKIKNINTVLFGRSIMECWYFSPFPKEYHPDGPVDCLYFCEFTLRFFRTKEELVRYQSKPSLPRHPPGSEIYRDSKVSMFELDGAVEKIYCQNLCYFAKLFLDHKTLVYDVDPFLFYVLCTQDDKGFHPVGYFSKEKYSETGYNLACILTFPSSQRQGFGRFLIAFSYELSKKENKLGSPEKPLSDLGNLSYRSYWAGTVLNVLRNFQGQALSILDLAKMTSILCPDIIQTLDMLGLLQYLDGQPIICAPKENIDDLMLKYPQNGLQVDPEKLHWAPLYVTDPKKDKFKFQGGL